MLQSLTLICGADILENGAENGGLAQSLCQDPLAMTCPGEEDAHMWGNAVGFKSRPCL